MSPRIAQIVSAENEGIQDLRARPLSATDLCVIGLAAFRLTRLVIEDDLPPIKVARERLIAAVGPDSVTAEANHSVKWMVCNGPASCHRPGPWTPPQRKAMSWDRLRQTRRMSNKRRREGPPISTGFKRCYDCGQTLWIQDFSTTPWTSDGRTRQCRPCKAREMKVWHRSKRARQTRTCVVCGKTKLSALFVLYQPECLECRSKGKRCTGCAQWVRLESFSPDRRRFDGRQCFCKPCKAERARTAKVRRQARLAGSAPNRKRIRNARLRERHRADAEYRQARQAEHRERYLVRRAGLTLQAIFARDCGRCYLCDEAVNLSDAAVDHVIPVVWGGPPLPANVALTHRSCNARKGARFVWDLEWAHPDAIKVAERALRTWIAPWVIASMLTDRMAS